MSKDIVRTFSRAFKLKVIERMDAGENVSALSRERGVKGIR
jgi:transposase-like protein